MFCYYKFVILDLSLLIESCDGKQHTFPRVELIRFQTQSFILNKVPEPGLPPTSPIEIDSVETCSKLQIVISELLLEFAADICLFYDQCVMSVCEEGDVLWAILLYQMKTGNTDLKNVSKLVQSHNTVMDRT